MPSVLRLPPVHALSCFGAGNTPRLPVFCLACFAYMRAPTYPMITPLAQVFAARPANLCPGLAVFSAPPHLLSVEPSPNQTFASHPRLRFDRGALSTTSGLCRAPAQAGIMVRIAGRLARRWGVASAVGPCVPGLGKRDERHQQAQFGWARTEYRYCGQGSAKDEETVVVQGFDAQRRLHANGVCRPCA